MKWKDIMKQKEIKTRQQYISWCSEVNDHQRQNEILFEYIFFRNYPSHDKQ